MRADLSRAAVWIVLVGGCVAGLLIVAAPSGAQNVGRASGVVRDLDGEPIKGATVTAENAEAAPRNFTAVTDEKGRFGMLGLRRGVWKFTVQAPGYDTVSAPASIQTLRANPPISFTLARTPESESPDAIGRTDLDTLQAKLDVAASFAKTGLYDEAIAAYEGVVGQVPALSSVHLQLGWLYEQKKDTAKAIAAYERAIGTEPESPQAERARTLIARLKSAPGASVPRLNPPGGAGI
jgi:tetratricopeptide (TPR) repeat protein